MGHELWKSYALGDVVKIRAVDMFGWSGRDYPPKREDEGRLARVEKVELLAYPTSERAELEENDDSDVEVFQMLVCKTLDNAEPLELVDYEVMEVI